MSNKKQNECAQEYTVASSRGGGERAQTGQLPHYVQD